MRLGLISVPVPPSQHLTGALAGAWAVPETCDWLSEARAMAGVEIANGDARGNDRLSCCVPVGAWQAIRIMRAVTAGDCRDFTGAQVLDTYHDWAGYDGTEATDLGTRSDMAGVLWGSKGLWWTEQLEDVPQVVPLGIASLRRAVAFLGAVQLDLSLLDGWQDAETWDATGGGLWGRHRVVATGYDAAGVDVLTWGLRRRVTNAALAAQALGCWACVDRRWLRASGDAPSGLNLAELAAEARGMG